MDARTDDRQHVFVQAENLTRSFASVSGPVFALNDVNVAIRAGEFWVVQGPSGCGKSTLLHLLGLLDRPTSGRVLIDGSPASECSSDEKARIRRESIGYLFQDAGLIDRLSVWRNVALPLAYRGAHARTQEADVARYLERVGLAERAHSRVNELSGGQRQRVGLARALVNQPALLICDEPTASLDKTHVERVTRLLEGEARKGVAVIASSHDPQMIERAGFLLTLSHGAVTDIERRR